MAGRLKFEIVAYDYYILKAIKKKVSVEI